MVDASPSATSMPAQPVATVTSIEAPFPPADPLPAFVAPAVTDPVSNLDFLPVDDAFALEMRSETIEQLVGGDALRRGVSERIEAGRSQTNAGLVAGRDRVRVHATLHEHTGHGLAEQAAHLHTTVDGRLDVHAGSEDTVLLAGHMRDLWDGGAAIVAAMTDDTAAGGGIRVTTPLDLWVHGLMGVEERIGTCTADAVLMESSATHYEREYGPGVHAAGLAVYTGSLYQSSRTSFRPLMRVSSGVRNLIAGGDGGRAGGDAGAGSAPGASPPPVPAEPGAPAESASTTLAAGRRVVEAPATALDTADALTDARRVPLEELVDSVDARAAEQMGEADTVVRAENQPELTRSADTAEQLGALRETLCIDKTASGSEAAGGSRASEFECAVSMHPASGRGGPLEIEPPSAIYSETAPMARPHSGIPWRQAPEMKLGLLAGADRPPQSAEQESDFHAVYRRLRELRSRYVSRRKLSIAYEFELAVTRIAQSVTRQFKICGGNAETLGKRRSGVTIAERAYVALQEMARQAGSGANFAQSDRIRGVLDTIDRRAVEILQNLYATHGIDDALSTRMMQRWPATTRPTLTVAAIPPPASTSIQSGWTPIFRQLRGLACKFRDIGRTADYAAIERAIRNVSQTILRRFRKFGGDPKQLLPSFGGATKTEQAYRALDDMARRAAESDNAARAQELRQALQTINKFLSDELDKLTTRFGELESLFAWATDGTRPTQATQDMQAMRLPSVTFPSTPVPPTVQLHVPVRAHPIAPAVNPAFPEPAGGLVHATVVPGPTPASSLPGPSRSEAGDLGRWRLDPLATAPGTTAAEPAAIETIVTPSLGGTSSFWLQPANPGPAPVTVPFDPGLHHAGETAQPPPVTTAPSSIAPALSPGAAFLTPSWLDVDFTVERALLADMLPPGFDASRLIDQARSFAEFGLADELAARRLPIQTIDVLMDGYRANDEGSRNAQRIESLRSLKESIERALHAAYPGQVEPEWLDLVRALEPPRRRGEPASPSAASATALPELGLTDIARLVGTGEGALHPAPLPPPSAPGRTGAGAGAPPPTADRWGIRPQGMSGGPHPVAFDPWFAPPGPSSQVVYTRAIRTPVMSTGAPPRWLGAETPGFARAASGAVELPFWRREEIALRFGTEDAVHDAELTVQLGGADALGWSVGRWLAALADLGRINAIVQSDSAAAAAMVDVDWSAIEALVRILDDPSPSP